MRKSWIPVLIALLAAAPTLATAAVPPPNAAEMTKLQYLVGAWDCTWKAGDASGAVHLSFESVMNGAWLRETESGKSRSGEDVVRSMHYTGYDPVQKKWMHLGPNGDGTFAVAQSADAARWQTMLPTADESLTFEKVSSTAFTETSIFQSDGKTVTFLQSCRKTAS